MRSHCGPEETHAAVATCGHVCPLLPASLNACWFCFQGYAFVVFADSVIVQRAIEELDCKVVEGKILVSMAGLVL